MSERLDRTANEEMSNQGSQGDAPWRAFFSIVNLGNLAAVIALVTSLYTLVFLIRPSLKPPEKLGAEIGKVQFEHSAKFGDYIKVEEMASQAGDPPVDTPGAFLYIQVDLQGYQSRTYGMYFSVLYAKTSSEVPFEYFKFKGETIAVSDAFTPRASADKVTARAWVGYPRTSRPIVVRVRLYDLGPSKDYEARVRKESIPGSKEPIDGLLDVKDTSAFVPAVS
jgi:hypothetical protein